MEKLGSGSGRAPLHPKIEFCRRLGPSWQELATQLLISDHAQEKWKKGTEAEEIWDELIRLNALDQLSAHLRAIGRDDLVKYIEQQLSLPQDKLDADTPESASKPIPHEKKVDVNVLWGCVSVTMTLSLLFTLLLPQSQPAREMPRRAQSRNNLKQIGLALHLYTENNGAFPSGTVPGSAVAVDSRLSWESQILPYLEQTTVYNEINFRKAWDDPANAPAVGNRIAVFVNPSLATTTAKHNTDYCGMAGLGVDGPRKKVTDKGAGIFAFDYPRRIQDITDGLSNCLMVGEVSEGRGPWAQGGNPTIRPLTKRPYIKGPDGFGGGRPSGCNFLLGDGSVRSISEAIDPSVMEAMTTIQGGETVSAE